ncbi:HtaA domain-containing protein [Parafrankia sp. FMc2]|uniref:HtaA domain-containing protein n=1 Tax=Parafrankia sp. FMc2 TaxID=3233196 RepID=UPI0034D5A519
MPDASSADSPEAVFGMRWGIKGSFIDYVRQTPDGKGWLGDGAVPVGEYEILFALKETGARPTTASGTERVWAFSGEARFSGHFGMLYVSLAAPELTRRDGSTELTVVAPFSGTGELERLPLVTLRLEQQPAPDGIERWRGTDVRLTEAGAGLFNDVYPPGEPFEPLTVMLPALDDGWRGGPGGAQS